MVIQYNAAFISLMQLPNAKEVIGNISPCFCYILFINIFYTIKWLLIIIPYSINFVMTHLPSLCYIYNVPLSTNISTINHNGYLPCNNFTNKIYLQLPLRLLRNRVELLSEMSRFVKYAYNSILCETIVSQSYLYNRST